MTSFTRGTQINNFSQFSKFLNSMCNFQFIFGLYLTYHFMGLNQEPYLEETFGCNMPYDVSLSPTYIFPNIINIVNKTIGMSSYLYFLTFCSISFMFGTSLIKFIPSQLTAGSMWLGWVSLLNRNPLISNPGIPYVGWLLLVYTFYKHDQIPKRVFWLSWFLMALGYTASGLHKLKCQSWLDGSAITHVLNTPLARDNFLRNFMLNLPVFVLKMITWSSLMLEILFLPLGVFYHTRFLFWCAYIMFHLGIVSVISFTDLTLGVLMIHFFTFDHNWLFKHKKNE